MTSEVELARAVAQALASSRLAGHDPSPEFLKDCERFARGEITEEQFRAASLARALEQDGATKPNRV